MSANRIAQDDQPRGLIGTSNSGEEEEDDHSYCPSRPKRIGSALGFALTLAFILCTTLASGRPLPPHIASQTMKLLKGREREEQVLGLMQPETCSASSSGFFIGLSKSVIEMSKGKKRKLREERRASGLGSHPPSCKSKCGRCVPCKPVRVPIHPGRNRPSEYYPEAWRCKCGNKLYMP